MARAAWADPALAGRKAELVYSPLDLTCGIRVRYRGADMGTTIRHVIGRHSHPQASPPAPAPAQPTGIDYLRMIAGEHRPRASRRPQLPGPAGDDEDVPQGFR